ncbi:sporulation protein RMD1 [Geobacter sp. OR-1]|uniref:RMD1 family protein n=1 Tax=Geobacter sp. OR-1 TaxID=1266765 RepID=UPI000544278F|nr:RMD1 family protein [Geobacter sp. OR-1]GAM07963.1 sporulation protein RMD1 [Geobacter sp. OR-1]
MTVYPFLAVAIEGDTDRNRLAAALGVTRKLSWEEPLILAPADLTLFEDSRIDAPRVYLTSFGSAVFFNCPDDFVERFFDRLAQRAAGVKPLRPSSYRERYALRLNEGEKITVANDMATMPQGEKVYLDIIAYVLAKSVALEQLEALVDVVFDRMEEIIDRLGRGELKVADSELARTAATILNFRYRSISHIMILDKPDITWESEEADRFHATLANMFELSQRYSQIRQKSDTLLHTNEVFAGLSHARRSARLEWIIIALIAVEILLFVFEMVRH